MIIDIERFVAKEQLHWQRLESLVLAWESDPWTRRTLAEVREMDRLYQRASADFARISSQAADPALVRSLESLVARAHVVIYGPSGRRTRIQPLVWLVVIWPQTFRAHFGAFLLAATALLVGALFGAGAMAFDERAKPLLIGPFGHLAGDPSERVRIEEESVYSDDTEARFAAYLMTHNIRVSLLALGLGLTAGIGTLVLMFYNGVLLGAIILDYLRAGEGMFLAGWLLPHGVIEIPAILVGAQAGLVLAGALLGGRDPRRLRDRMRATAPAVATLAGALALMLVWAGFVEAMFSQRHQPILPYWLKILFGVIEGTILVSLLYCGGRASGWLAKRSRATA